MTEYIKGELLPILASLASPVEQTTLWLDPAGRFWNLKDVCLWTNLLWPREAEAVPEGQTSDISPEEHERLLPLRRAFLKVLGKYHSAYDIPLIVKDPDWPEVVRLAQEAYEFVQSLEPQPNSP